MGICGQCVGGGGLCFGSFVRSFVEVGFEVRTVGVEFEASPTTTTGADILHMG